MPEVYSALFADYMATVVGAFYRTASLTHTEFVCKIPDRQLKRLVVIWSSLTQSCFKMF